MYVCMYICLSVCLYVLYNQGIVPKECIRTVVDKSLISGFSLLSRCCRARHRRRHREREKQQRSEETPVKKASPRRAKKR